MPPSDEALMALCRDGDVAAFETLVQRRLRAVTGHIQRIVHDADEAQDLAQDVFFKVYTSRGSYTGEGKFITWLFRIATNAAIDHLRRRSTRRSVSLATMAPAEREDEPEPELHENMADGGAQTPFEILSAQEEWAQFGSALERLSDAQRIVFEMRMVQGLDYKTIAQRIGCTPEAARARMQAAKQVVKREVGNA